MKSEKIFGFKKIFFDNLNIKQIIFKNTFWLGLAEFINGILKFFLFVFIARILGATEYGKFTFALSFAGLFGFIAEMGLYSIIVREFSQNKERESDVSSLFSFKILSNLLFFIFVFFFSFFATPDQKIRNLIWLLSFLLIFENFLFLFYAFFNARQKMEYEALSKILENSLIFIFCILTLLFFPSVFRLGVSYVFGAFLTFVFVLLFFYYKIFPLSLKFDINLWKRYLTFAWPLFVLGLLASFSNNFDSVLLGYFQMMKENGWYNAVKRIVSISVLPCGILSASFFPAMNKFFAESKEKFKKIWFLFLKMIFFVVFPVLLGGIFLAPQIIDFVYDPSFFPAILALRFLFLAIFFSVISLPFSRILLVFNKQDKILYIFLVSTILSVLLNIFLIPYYSLNGAAFSSFLSYLLYFLLVYYFTKRYFSFKLSEENFLPFLLGVVISSFLMIFFISQNFVSKFHVFWIIIFGALFYLLIFSIYCFCLKLFKKDVFNL